MKNDMTGRWDTTSLVLDVVFLAEGAYFLYSGVLHVGLIFVVGGVLGLCIDLSRGLRL